MSNDLIVSLIYFLIILRKLLQVKKAGAYSSDSDELKDSNRSSSLSSDYK